MLLFAAIDAQLLYAALGLLVYNTAEEDNNPTQGLKALEATDPSSTAGHKVHERSQRFRETGASLSTSLGPPR
jgi:hypothetical protein